MNKIGFKMSYELKTEKKRTRKIQAEDETQLIIPGTAMAHTLDILIQIEEFEKWIPTAGFARLSKAKKVQMLNSYRFLLTTLALIQTPSNIGVNEVAKMSPLGFQG
jgi:hypothetical protein